jgi:hypothetical protein
MKLIPLGWTLLWAIGGGGTERLVAQERAPTLVATLGAAFPTSPYWALDGLEVEWRTAPWVTLRWHVPRGERFSTYGRLGGSFATGLRYEDDHEPAPRFEGERGPGFVVGIGGGVAYRVTRDITALAGLAWDEFWVSQGAEDYCVDVGGECVGPGSFDDGPTSIGPEFGISLGLSALGLGRLRLEVIDFVSLGQSAQHTTTNHHVRIQVGFVLREGR